jgi:hypothetical protein
VVSRLGDRLGGGFAWAFNIGGPWLAVAFVLGRYGRSFRDAAFRGALVLVTAVISYYAFVRFVEHLPGHLYRNYRSPSRLMTLVTGGPAWIPIAIIGGALLGVSGLGSRSSGRAVVRVVSVALMSGVLAGEGLLWLVRRGNAGDFVFALEMVVGVTLPWLLLRERSEQLRAWWIAVAIGLGVLAIEAMIRVVLSL